MMRFDARTEPIADDDATIRAAVESADLPPLLAAVAQATGDLSLLRNEFRPDPNQFFDPNAGIAPDAAARARDEVTAALIRFRDAGCVAAPGGGEEQLQRSIEFLVGGDLDDAYFRLLCEELAPDGRDLRAPQWRADDDAPLTVAIIGAGMSGIVAAHRLRQANVRVAIFDKNDEVGGTWWENTYPGCRVDVPNHLYSYSFAQTNEWPNFFSPQEVLLDYFRSVVDAHALRDCIRFGSEIIGATWDDAAQQWELAVRTRETGAVEHHRFPVLVSAVGQLNQPLYPDIPGRDNYAGTSFHSARWEHDVDLTGRRVAVIGTGASAAQFIPCVAEQAAELVVFQRTPPWLLPMPNYQDELPEGVRWLLHHVPRYAHWNRLWIFWRMHEGLRPSAIVDPDWPSPERSVSAANDMVREFLTAYIRATFPAELVDKVLPQYPPISKRIVLDNGIYPATFARDNVQLVTEKILEITEKGITTVDGNERDFDVIIYGTGFQASNFLTPMKVVGRGGVDLHERWAGEARAYLGITVPEFPNLFLMYGPNTNIVINGSIIYFSECETHYIVDAVRTLLEAGKRSLECRPEIYDEYARRVDAENRRMAWGASTVNTWYKNAQGKITQNWPFSLLEYWRQTRAVDPDDYVLR